MRSIAEWMRYCREETLKKYDDWLNWETTPKAIAYIHSELSEALEAWRDNDILMFGEELADTIIRLLDLAEALKIPLEEQMEQKMLANRERKKNHGRINV